MQAKTLRLTCGETVKVQSQWAAECEKRGTTVSTSAWEATSGGLSGESLDGTRASVLLAVDGCGRLKNTVTLADGEILVRWWIIDVQGDRRHRDYE